MTHQDRERSDFGRRVRRARHALELSQYGLARIVGVTPLTIRNWEARTMPTAEHAADLAHALGTTVEWLLTGEGKGPAEAA